MITDLRLQQFRSYSDSTFEFSPNTNIVVGPNASGKTNLLEAVLVAALGSSYRVKDTDLIQFGKPWARVDTNLLTGETRTVKIVAEPKPDKSYELTGKTFKRLTLQHTIPVVLFEPNHLQLFSGGPERRRNYLDDLLEQITPGYARTRRDYKRALAQRNALLKRLSVDHTQLFPWNLRLSQLAGQMVRARTMLVEQLQDELPVLYRELSQAATPVRIAYESRWPVDVYESNLLKKLEADIDLDRQRGFTGGGPHRDDMIIYFADKPAQETASRGEVRTAILALKIIELQIIQQVRDITPLLLLDDVFSELDGKRRHALTSYLEAYQTFITTTDADLVLNNFTTDCNIIPIK